MDGENQMGAVADGVCGWRQHSTHDTINSHKTQQTQERPSLKASEAPSTIIMSKIRSYLSLLLHFFLILILISNFQLFSASYHQKSRAQP